MKYSIWWRTSILYRWFTFEMHILLNIAGIWRLINNLFTKNNPGKKYMMHIHSNDWDSQSIWFFKCCSFWTRVFELPISLPVTSQYGTIQILSRHVLSSQIFGPVPPRMSVQASLNPHRNTRTLVSPSWPSKLFYSSSIER